MKQTFTLFLILCNFSLHAQTLLEADGKGKTYELINSVLAPNYDVIETPDCAHKDFGNHITETWDADLEKNVFVFHAHVNEDNDRCKNFDRQRTEIKTYRQSPDSLIGTLGETVVYKWKFKLENDFQASNKFTHIHQIKAVGGPEESMPSITFTLRKSKEDKFQIRYASNLEQNDLTSVPLDDFKGVWVEAYERITYGETGQGSYEVTLTRVDNGKVLLAYSNNAIRMWKTDAAFLRPKWGIYRSLQNPSNLRDEEVRFADFYIQEEK